MCEFHILGYCATIGVVHRVLEKSIALQGFSQNQQGVSEKIPADICATPNEHHVRLFMAIGETPGRSRSREWALVRLATLARSRKGTQPRFMESARAVGYGVIGSPTDSGSVSLGSSPGTPAVERLGTAGHVR